MATIEATGSAEMDGYISELAPNERAYALEMWDSLEDKIGSEWPQRELHGISFHRSLEIESVGFYYHDLITKERLKMMKLL